MPYQKKQKVNKIDAVFEGGGVKGSALVGAVAYTESLGYTFENLAGTSAGAIMASLLAAGYKAQEIKKILDALDYKLFKDLSLKGQVPLFGPLLSLLFEKGIYVGNFFENWLRKLLKAKGVRTFGDLIIDEYKNDERFKYKLQVIASDISRGRLLVLPTDVKDFGINPDKLDIAFAVRMSMGIPYFFQPVFVKGKGAPSYVVDGGILSNYPVWLLDDGTDNPPWPTIGYKLVEPDEGKPHKINGPISMLSALFDTMGEAHDARYIKDIDFMRTIPIPTLGVHTTDFNLSQKTKDDLYNSGFEAAQKFFDTWSFDRYKKKFLEDLLAHRTEKLWKK